jgi:hypothetical protein
MTGQTKVIAITIVATSLVALALGMFFTSYQSTAENQTETVLDNSCPLPEETETMDLPETNVMPNASKPPIDASAPAKTETATFSLG